MTIATMNCPSDLPLFMSMDRNRTAVRSGAGTPQVPWAGVRSGALDDKLVTTCSRIYKKKMAAATIDSQVV